MNRVEIIRTTFVDGRDGDKSYGYRIHDDHECTYNNMMDPKFFKLSPIDAFVQVIETASDTTQQMIDYIEFSQTGVSIDYEYLTWDEIKHLF
jgi:hypothetical protein